MARNATNPIVCRASGTRLQLCGGLNQEIALRADRFFRQIGGVPCDLTRDLLVMAAAVYGVDRCVRRASRSSGQGWIRDLHLNIEVSSPSFWQRPDISNLVHEVVTFLSDDNWTIDFVAEAGGGWSLPSQHLLALPAEKGTRIALYSGGLDSAAGLALQTLAPSAGYQLITVIHQSSIHRMVMRQLQELRQHAKAALSPAFLSVHLRGGSSARIDQQEQTQRSRGFLFGAAAAAAADVSGAAVIEVLENGVGAVNVPLMTGMLSGGHATRGAHPQFLKLLSTLVSHLLQRSVTFDLPFRQMTKGEMVAQVAMSGLGPWMLKSRSCVHTSLRVSGKHHCGTCPACLERRQSFLSAGVPDPLTDYVTDAFAANEPSMSEEERAYIRLELVSSRQLAVEGDSRALQRARRHLSVSDACSANMADAEWIALIRRHAREWCAVAARTKASGWIPMDLDNAA